MIVHIPSPLVSYTHHQKDVVASGATIEDLLWDLNTQFPGIRFRMIDEQDHLRPHMRIFVNSEEISSLKTSLNKNDDVHILQALSGG